MDLAAAFGEIGLAFSTVLGGPFHDAHTVEHVDPVYDDGGSIVEPGIVMQRSCSVQIDAVTEAMRQAPNFAQTDMLFIVLASTLNGDLGTSAMIDVIAGPFAGLWSVEGLERDPVAAGWVGRGRRA